MPKHNSINTNHSKLILSTVIVAILLTSVLAFALFRLGGTLNNQIQQSETLSQPPNPEAPVTQDPSPEVMDRRYLTLEDWGVKFEVPEGIGEARYYRYENNDAYSFTTGRIEALGQRCTPESKEVAIRPVSIFKYDAKLDLAETGSPPILISEEPIDGYYYYYTGPQSYCSTDGMDIQNQDIRLLESMVKTVSPAR